MFVCMLFLYVYLHEARSCVTSTTFFLSHFFSDHSAILHSRSEGRNLDKAAAISRPDTSIPSAGRKSKLDPLAHVPEDLWEK